MVYITLWSFGHSHISNGDNLLKVAVLAGMHNNLSFIPIIAESVEWLSSP